MRWLPQDFAPGALDLNTKFQTVLPGADLLRDTVLDPGLDYANWMPGSPELKALTVQLFTVDTLRLQQYLMGWSARNMGVLSEYAPYFKGALGAFDVPLTTSMEVLIEGIVLNIIGSAGAALSAIPNPYTQIAAALIGVGTMLYEALDKDPATLPPFVIPAQEYNERTDQDQFNTKVRALLQLGESYQAGVSLTDARKAFDYTPLFMPRMVGDPVLEYRYQGHRLGVAFGFGKHGGIRIIERDCDVQEEKGKTVAWCDEDIPPGKSFTAGGPLDLGFVPGGVRIASVIQCFPTESPIGSAPWYDPRCGGTKIIDAIDVGMYYPSTNQGIQMLWNMAMKNSPQMFAIDTQRLHTAWSDTIEAALDGIVYLWDHPSKDLWGQGTWHWMISMIASAFTTSAGGGQGIPGQIGSVSPDVSNCGKLTAARDPVFFELWYRQNLYNDLIKPALNALADRQAQYLNESLIAAYLPRPLDQSYVCGALNDKNKVALAMQLRTQILNGPAKGLVNLVDVVDLEYKAKLVAALPKFKSFDLTSAPVGPGRPSGRIIMPPFPPSGTPPFVPPRAPPPRPGPLGWPTWKKGVAMAAVGAGVTAFLARDEILDYLHGLRGRR